MALSVSDKKSLLAEHFLLRHVPENALDRLVESAQTSRFSGGDTIFRKGDNANSMMVIVSGEVKFSSPATQGDNVTFARMTAGDVFGEIALIDGYERSADAEAVEDTEILEVDREAFLPILQENADLCINLLKIVCNRIRHTNSLLEDFSYLDLRHRLAKRLVYLSNSGPDSPASQNISVRVPKDELIAMMGVDRNAVENELTIWSDLGLVENETDWVTVNDGEKLAKI